MSERAVTDNLLSCEEVLELLPLYALGALDRDEVAQVEAHLPLCPSCSAELIRFDSITGALAAPLEPIAPDPSVRAGLFDRIAVTPQETLTPIAPSKPVAVVAPVSEKIVPISTARRGSWKTWLVSVAAAFLILAGGAGYWINSLTDDRDDAQSTAAMLANFMAPGSTELTLPAMNASLYGDTQGSSKLMKDPQGNMIVVVANCPPSDDDRVYKVWVAVDGNRQVVGDMKIGADGSGWMPVTFPADMPNPQQLGVSVIDGSSPLNDLFIGTMSG